MLIHYLDDTSMTYRTESKSSDKFSCAEYNRIVKIFLLRHLFVNFIRSYVIRVGQ